MLQNRKLFTQTIKTCSSAMNNYHLYNFIHLNAIIPRSFTVSADKTSDFSSSVKSDNIPAAATSANPETGARINAATTDVHAFLKSRDMNPDIQYCIKTVRESDNELYLSLLFTPKQHQSAIFIIHAFNIELNRVVNNISDKRLQLMRLQWWKNSLSLIEANEIPPIQPVAVALSLVINSYNLPMQWLHRIVDARIAELSAYLEVSEEVEELKVKNFQPSSVPQIHAHSDATYASLLYLSNYILGLQANQTQHEAAAHLGKSLGLVQILRSIPFNASKAQLYIPSAITQECKLDIDSLFRGENSKELHDAVYKLAIVAKNYIDEARKLNNQLPKEGKSLLLPAVLADRFLDQLEAANFNIFAPSLHSSHTVGLEPLRVRFQLWRHATANTF
jgi:NADH dehydrogenase [ubiquinone] 1 alpha subcomplex assembly factor 6